MEEDFAPIHHNMTIIAPAEAAYVFATGESTQLFATSLRSSLTASLQSLLTPFACGTRHRTHKQVRATAF